MIDSTHADPSGEVPRFATGSIVSPGLQAALKASTEVKYRPVLEGLSKSVLSAAMAKGALGVGLPKSMIGAELKARIDGRPALRSPGAHAGRPAPAR